MPLRPVFAVSRSFPSLSWRAVGLFVIVFRLFPSRLPSRYSGCVAGRLCLSRGVGLFRGVVLRGWRGSFAISLVVPLGGSFPVGARGGAFWLVFSYGIIGGLFDEEWAARLRRDERRRTK